MAPVSKALGLAVLLAASAGAAPLNKRDLVTDVTTVNDITYVTQWVTVPAGGAAAAATSTAVAASAAYTGSAVSAAGYSSDKAHYHSFGGGYPGGGRGRPTAYSVPSAVSSYVAPPTSTAAPSSYVAPSSTVAPSSYVAPSSQAPSSQAPAPVPTSSAVSSAPAYTPSSTAAPAPSTVASSAPAPSSTTPASSGGANSKRGLAYNDASLLDLYSSANMGWAYNWGSSAGGNLPSGTEFVPLLWSSKSSFTGDWNTNAQTAISNGAKHLMSFNEPDLTSQANMSPSDAAAAYKQYMMPFASKAKLGAPAVTNGGSPMGLTWLQQFTDACDGCQVDFVAIHWYDSATNIDYFKQHVEQAHQQSGKPVWVTEIGASGSDEQISSFMSEVMPWMDSLDYVDRYAYYMVGDGYLVDGDSLSSYGKTYATCT